MPEDTVTSEPALLRMRGMHKTFPGVHAVRGVDLTLHEGEVLALVGENGAGKSTLMKILGGAYVADSGTIHIRGKEASIRRPSDAQHYGVAIIYQEFNLVPYLSARENIFLGREDTRAGLLKGKDEHRRAAELFEHIGVRVDPEERCDRLTVAQQQVVEIARALSVEANILVMDEPTAALTRQEVKRLFQIIHELKKQGIGIIYISHRLEEIFHVADRVMVMRDGGRVDTRAIEDVDRQRIIEMMVGRRIDNEFPKRPAEVRETLLEVQKLSRGDAVRDVSFSLRSGEVLGLTGLVGAGRTEAARLIFGADRPDRGQIYLNGKPIRIRSPRHAISRGIGLLTEDRQNQGLVLCHSVRANFSLPNLGDFSSAGFVNQSREVTALARYVDNLDIKLPHYEQTARNLSGGNQQKVVLAKWLQRNCRVIIFDEPTRGIDVATKYEIYLLINELAEQGKGVLMITSELPEALGMADRLLVMRSGRIAGEITEMDSATQEQIMELAVP